MAADPPLCDCHDVPMRWHKDATRRGEGRWRCREKRKEADAAQWRAYYYDRMPATVRIPRQLAMRRSKALTRRRERQQGGH